MNGAVMRKNAHIRQKVRKNKMFQGYVLDICYHTWSAYKKAWNQAVKEEKLFDKDGRKITRTYKEEEDE